MISFQTSIQHAAVGAVLILGSLGLAVAPGHAAPPAPAGPAASPATSPYPLQGDTTNTGTTTTHFQGPGFWQFANTGSGDHDAALGADCTHGWDCKAVVANASGTGVMTIVSNTNTGLIYGIHSIAQDTDVGGISYGGFFTSLNTKGKGVGVFARGDTGVYAYSPTGVGIKAISDAGSAIHAISNASFSYGVYASGSAAGVYGVGDGTGVLGSSTNGLGVYGYSSTNVAVRGISQGSIGVFGKSNGAGSNNIGVYGLVSSAPDGSIAVAGMISSSLSYAGVFTNPTGTALWGVSTSDRGVLGTSTSYYGVVGSSGSSTGVRAASTSGTGLYATTSSGAIALRARNTLTDATHYAGIFDGNVVINGDFSVTGSKNNRVATSKGDVLLYAEESTITRYSDQGTATLKDGRAVIAIDPLFAETVDLTDGYQVFVTPYSFDTAGLAVGNRTATSFEVRELGKGTGHFQFDWRISAPRKGYGTQRLAPAAPLPPAEK